MTSTFTWLDHSDHDRQRVLEAIDRFKETETRDELGLGSIRDAFADYFFPGTNVIQTRARYFLFVPWMYLYLEKQKAPSAEVESKARRAETRLIQVLKDSDDSTGNLGSRAGDTLKRLPSNVYWLGMATWKIRLFDGSQDDYHRSLDRFYTRSRDERRDDDGELLGGATRRNWHGGLPQPPKGFPDEADFALDQDEARYLVERIQHGAHGSFLAFLALRGKPADVAAPWMHPQLGEVSSEVRGALADARCFAETMHGAAWLYNLMLAEERAKATENKEPVERFRAELAAWAAEVGARAGELAAWDRDAFWARVGQLGRVKEPTKTFVNSWLRLVPWERPDGGAQLAAARSLILHRESQLKHGRARLTNPRALELWNGRSGIGRLDYRWGAARRLCDDLFPALGRGGNDAGSR